ncbi:hypothetical protein B0J13DRAFT_587135 [Dactylonectria estremocensis]|uniref:Tyrosinase copper-binding domain-containing protein n=1 Tax=Dactylonectria estremocensis TaxID=1079267 RepID=A0A9P9ECU4_9HYPO|nr:hypothetical protein B0J13DRAFT_587135 [Dactylonectria estremocensis]
MRLSTLFTTVAVAITSVLCTTTYNCGCTNPLIRKEWRTLNTKEKHEYIDAVKCLASKPSQTGNIYEGAKSRFDDFQATHIVNTDLIHYVVRILSSVNGIVCLLPSMKRIFETSAATRELNPTGVYSVEDFFSSPIFDRETGFGGNGIFIDTASWTNLTRQVPSKTGGGCVINGPFVKGEFTVNIGPGNSSAYNPRCLSRDIAPEFAISKLSQCIVDWTLEAEDFYEFDRRVQGGVTTANQGYHGGGHLGIGGDIGEMGDMYSSPGDPIFFMHHTNVDRLWDTWQRLDWPTRRSDISGPDTQYAYPFNFFGDRDYQNITLDYVMDFSNLIPSRQYVTVKEVMDTQGGRFCYTYK